MSRNITQAFISAFFGRDGSDVALMLLEIEHPLLGTPRRIVLNTKPIVHQSNAYEPLYFECAFPDQQPDRPSGMKLRVDGVDRSMIEQIRTFQTPPTVKLKVVSASDPDDVQMETATMYWRLVTYGSHWIEGEIESPEVYNRSFPGDSFTPSVAPGLFREF